MLLEILNLYQKELLAFSHFLASFSEPLLATFLLGFEFWYKTIYSQENVEYYKINVIFMQDCFSVYAIKKLLKVSVITSLVIELNLSLPTYNISLDNLVVAI